MRENTRKFKRTSPKKRSRLSRRFRKGLIRFLTALNEIDFSFLRPVGMITAAALFITVFCLLPVSRTDNTGSPETAYGEELAMAIRNAVSCHSTDSGQAADVVALFLPSQLTGALSTGAAETLFSGKPLYSFYLTGRELSALAESAVSFPSANPDSALFLSGLNYSYHPLRLPMNRITEISFTDGTKILPEGALYRVITTDEIFPLLQYLSYRSQKIMHVSPKDANGVLLSAYEEALLTTEQLPLSVESSLHYASLERRISSDMPASTVTKLGGFNLITLFSHPNRMALYISLLAVLFLALLAYCIPRIRRVQLWIRIYAIHRRKRGHIFYRRRGFFRKA